MFFRLLNLFSGFAFIIFGYSALNMIPELREYIGQQLIFEAYFYALGFSFTFIIWALTYFEMREGERELEEELESLTQQKESPDITLQRKHEIDISDNLKKGLTNKRQMELDL